MGVIIFLVGFMLCGFIVCGIFVYTVWKVLRAEDIGGFSVELKHKKRPWEYRYADFHRAPVNYQSYAKFSKNKIDTHKSASDIVDIFDDFLMAKDIKVPSEDDSDRDVNNYAAIYWCD